ncbi:hypothetical protein C0581_03240 [Candidatus Parcubacteria bacterium]|nr:MAG: hypothetical protein C0581_03240 [Candidatus Parcubacteria bacterium]
MTIKNPIIDKPLQTLDREIQALVAQADSAQKDKFMTARPWSWWTAIIVLYATGISAAYLVMILQPFITGSFENAKDVWFIYPLLLVFIVPIDIWAYVRIDREINSRKNYNKTYLYLHPEYVLERAGERITILPKESLLYAYEDYGPLSSHIAYRDIHGQGKYYEFMNCDEGTYKYSTARKEDLQTPTNIKRSGLVYKTDDLIGLPSPIRKAIMKKYKLTMPKDLNMIDRDEYDEEPPKPITI